MQYVHGARARNVALANEYLSYLIEDRNRRPQTVIKYKHTLGKLIDFANQSSILTLTTDDLRAFCHAPIERQRSGRAVGSSAAAATVKRKVAEVRSFYRWCYERRGLVSSNPARTLDAPTVYNESPKPVPDPYWRRLWASDLSDGDRVGFGFAYFVGLRRMEVSSLEAWHINNDTMQRSGGMLIGLVRKGGNANKGVPWQSCIDMHARRRPDLIEGGTGSFVEPLARLLDERADEPLLLPWQPTKAPPVAAQVPIPDGHFDPMTFNRRLRRACQTAGLDADAITPHMLRHSFVTNMLRMGVDLLTVSRLANHSSVSVTQRYAFTENDPLAAMLESDDDAPALIAVRRF